MTHQNISESRDKIIVRTSVVGIVANLFLSGFKAIVGVMANSIAVILDAVNNLSDALSSLITILGAKLSARKPDRNHPLGHGRIEYMSALIVSFIVLYAGATAAIESVKKIIHPEAA
ncbi:MAG: cation diffusion facilitator family transporter, partial [Spirochaetales bacterium]|nr:cation diffusion facilitator family transporter [Spirochaetales bacterium]